VAALNQLSEKLLEIRYLDKQKGFSKKQEWIDFIDLANTTKTLLADDSEAMLKN